MNEDGDESVGRENGHEREACFAVRGERGDAGMVAAVRSGSEWEVQEKRRKRVKQVA